MTILDEGTLYVATLKGNSPDKEITGDGELPEDGKFDGTGQWHNHGWVQATDVPEFGLPASADVVVPPLGAIWLVPAQD